MCPDKKHYQDPSPKSVITVQVYAKKKDLSIIYSCCVGSIFNLVLDMEIIQLARFTCCYVDMCCVKMTYCFGGSTGNDARQVS
jgi:hypothetical protein